MYNKKMLFDDAAKIGAPKADSDKIWKVREAGGSA